MPTDPPNVYARESRFKQTKNDGRSRSFRVYFACNEAGIDVSLGRRRAIGLASYVLQAVGPQDTWQFSKAGRRKDTNETNHLFYSCFFPQTHRDSVRTK